MKVATPLRTHGGKGPLAEKIVALFPPHRNYCEPFAGGLSVLLAKDPAETSEVVNDLHGGLSNFWKVLQDETAFDLLKRKLEATPVSELEWKQATRRLLLDDVDVDAAAGFFIRCRQSLAGRGSSFTPVSTSRLRRGQNEQVSSWLTAIEGLPAVHKRLQRVLILNRDGRQVVEQFDKPDTVIYADPPYCPETRTATKVYDHELTREQHKQLLDTLLKTTAASVFLSGYSCDLYEQKLRDWQRVEFEVSNHAAGGKQKRRMTEVVWYKIRSEKQCPASPSTALLTPPTAAAPSASTTAA